MSVARPLFFAALAIIADVCAAQAQLVLQGKPQPVTPAAQAQIAQRLPQVMATCSLNSRDHPHIIAPANVAAWQEMQARDHLRLQLAEPMQLRTGAGHSAAVPVREFIMALDHPRFPGPQLSRAGDDVVAYTKCSGGEVILFVCAAEIRAVMPSRYHGLCRYIQ